MLSKFRHIHIPTLAPVTIVNGKGVPRFWAAAWSSLLPALSAATIIKKLRYVDDFYDYSDRNYGCDHLDDALAKLNASALCDMLEGYFLNLRLDPGRCSGDSGSRQKSDHSHLERLCLRSPTADRACE